MTNAGSLRSEIEGQTILVTGASGGIGAAIVRRLAQEGAHPIIHYSDNEKAAKQLLEELDGQGHIVQANLLDPSAPTALFEKSVALASRIHAIVNNAGIRTEIDVDASLDDWHAAWNREFQVNLFAAADLCRVAIPHFKANGGGRIINMGSRAAQRGYVADCIPYAASKAALTNITKTLARNYGGDGICAITIAPGWVRTDMANKYVAKNGLDAAVHDIPIKAMAEPDEVAELVAFALRPSQRSLNGATLDINGGSYLR